MKCIVVGMHCSGKQELFDILTKQNVKCGKLFSNSTINDIRYDFFTDKDVLGIFENRAYMFIKELEEYSRESYEGLSLYEYDNNDVFILSPSQFMSIPIQMFNDDVCLVWMDNSKNNRKERFDEERRSYTFLEVENAEQREMPDFIKTIYGNKKFHVIYFSNEDIGRISSVVYALTKYNDLVENFEKTFV